MVPKVAHGNKRVKDLAHCRNWHVLYLQMYHPPDLCGLGREAAVGIPLGFVIPC